MKYASLAVGSLLMLCATVSVYGQQVLVESESFDQHGGWKLDTQFIENMGSPYLLAHGLGRPVEDATTTVAFRKPASIAFLSAPRISSRRGMFRVNRDDFSCWWTVSR